jgi:hypothetical protein
MATKPYVVDFGKIKDRGPFNPTHIDEGDYVATCVHFQDGESKAGNPMWSFGFKIPGKAGTFPYHIVIDGTQDWKIKNMIVSCGMALPKARAKVAPERFLKRKFGVTMVDDEYEGRLKSVINDMMPYGDVASNGAGKKRRPDDDDDEDLEEDDVEEDDEDEEDEEPEPPRRKRAAAKKAAPRKAATRKRRARDEDEDEDEEDLDELDLDEV